MRISDWSSDVCSSDLLSMLFGWIFINVVARVVGTIKNMWRNDRGIAGRDSDASLSLEISCAVIPQPLSDRGQAVFSHTAIGPSGPSTQPQPSRAASSASVSAATVRQPSARRLAASAGRSEEHTSELQSLMRISYAVFCLKKKKH